MFQEISYEPHGVLISYAIGLLGVLFFAWVFIFKKTGNGQPPLPPGPRPLPLVGNLLSLQPELHTYFQTLSQEHGPIFTLWFGRKIGIVITSPAMAREVLKDQDTTFANRDVPAVGSIISYGGKDIVWSPYGPEWRMMRKICIREMLSKSSLDSVYELRRHEFRQTIKFLYDQAERAVNIGEQMFLTVFNVTTAMMWGGTVKGKERESLGSEFRKIVAEMIELLSVPDVSDFYPGLAKLDLQGLQGKMKTVINRIDNIFDTIIDQRLGMDEKESKDFLQILLQLIKDGGDDKTPFTITHIKCLFLNMIGGGIDTTSTTVEFAMAEMMNKPKILRKVQQELDAMVGKDNIIEESHIHQLPYLHAVMKETLRFHPIGPLLVPHCPSDTCIVGGYTIPKGSRVFVNVWAIHRDPSIWKNPLEFCPERFLDSKWDYSGNDFRYFPFGSGRRACVGISSAERTVMYALASMIHSFDWKLPQGEKLELSEKFGIVLKKRNPLVAIPTPRLSHPTLYD